MKLALIVITLSLMVIPFLILFIVNGMRKTYRNAKQKFSDRAFLLLFEEHNYVLSMSQLTSLSPLTKTEVYLRLQTWANNGILRSLYANNGNTHYQLKEKLPTTNKIYDTKAYFEDRSLLEIVLKHTENPELSLAHFIWLFDMTVQEARKLLKRLVQAGLVKSYYDGNFQRVYQVKAFLSSDSKVEERLAIPVMEEVDDGRMPINDADILKLAIDNEGRLTPTVICIEKKIPLDDAQEVLDDLYEKGAFHIEVDEESGTIEYWLRDAKLYKK